MVGSPLPQFESPIDVDKERTCWGCGVRLLLPSNSAVFKCGWCGAITNDNIRGQKDKHFAWRRWRDRCFVSILSVLILFVICGGVWAVYPIVFSISLFSGIVHLLITFVLATSTITTFSFAAFCDAGSPPNRLWGSYPVVGKGDLWDYTFCQFCKWPKSPRTHHCRSCGRCVVDMDHHCPFIGNCVGASNHRSFVAFLISTIISTLYVIIMCIYAGLHTWPALEYKPLVHLDGLGSPLVSQVIKEIIFAMLRSAVNMSSRGIVLVYLIVLSVSVQIGLSVLLWQQLCFIYEGETYLSHLSSPGSSGSRRNCQNLLRFFGFSYPLSRYFPIFRGSGKRHKK